MDNQNGGFLPTNLSHASSPNLSQNELKFQGSGSLPNIKDLDLSQASTTAYPLQPSTANNQQAYPNLTAASFDDPNSAHGPTSWYQVEHYSSYFNVDTNQVLERMSKAFIPKGTFI